MIWHHTVFTHILNHLCILIFLASFGPSKIAWDNFEILRFYSCKMPRIQYPFCLYTSLENSANFLRFRRTVLIVCALIQLSDHCVRVQRSCENNVSLDQGGGLFHLKIENRITDDSSSVFDISKNFIQTLNRSDDYTFLKKRQKNEAG